MEESRKLSGKDLITIGIFSAIYFMLNLAAMFTGFVPVLWLLLPGVTGIVTGIPFLLMTSKVRKPGAVLIMGTITALLYFVTGQFTVLLLITFAIACILSELYRAVTKYDNSFTHMMISFVFFCYGMLGSPLAIWVYKDSFLAQIQQNGMSAEYVRSLSGLISASKRRSRVSNCATSTWHSKTDFCTRCPVLSHTLATRRRRRAH